jgi:methylthioribose-1-phosphate isomerase
MILAESLLTTHSRADMTPARFVTGLITERGVLKADRVALARVFPEQAGKAE